MLVAAWWRADMAGDKETAEAAAGKVATLLPQLNDFSRRYLASRDAQERSFILASMAVQWNLSPILFMPEKDFATRRKDKAAPIWCSFDSAEFMEQAKFQRSPTLPFDPASNPAQRDAEMAKLRQTGSGADWLMRTSLQRHASHPKDKEIGPVLQKGIAASTSNCPLWDDKLLKQAQELSARLAGSTPSGQVEISEATLKKAYEVFKKNRAAMKEYRTFHLMVNTEEEAKSALAQIGAGSSFESVASTISQDPGSKKKGGDLGWALPDNFTRNFAAAMREMNAPGLYPRPVKTEFGWHLIMIKDIRPAVVPGYEEIKPELERTLRKQGVK